jgi:hypothetical protein
MPVDFTKNFERHRVREPSAFQRGSLRTYDIGRPGYSKAVIGRLKGSSRTSLQSLLIARKERPEMKSRLRSNARLLLMREGWPGERRRHARAARKGRRRR